MAGVSQAATPLPVRLVMAPTGSLLPSAVLGATLPNGWVSAAQYDLLKPGLTTLDYGLYRFPNGSLSNNYHWNGGDYYDAELVFDAAKWASSDKSFAPGFFVDSRYRGTTRTGSSGGASRIVDKSQLTSWQSDPQVSEPPRVYLDLPGGPIARVLIDLANPVASAVDLATYDPPAPHGAVQEVPANAWAPLVPSSLVYRRVFRLGWRVEALFPPRSARHLRVVLTPPSGVAARVREVSVFDPADQDLVVHSPDPELQTKVVASPTHVAGVPRETSAAAMSFDFERFMAYLPAGAEPLICVNYGTGTPEEAAAWVEYANVKQGYGIRYWHVGNEPNGAWEEGGPVSARMYAERFVRFSAAMKAVDPSIHVIGPVYVGTLEDPDSQDLSAPPQNWLHSFLELVGDRERSDGRRYLDGVDIHQYPYFAQPGEQDEAGLLEASAPVLGRLERLRGWMRDHLDQHETRSVHMSEYNTMPANYFSGTMGVHNALATARIASSLIQTFPSQAHAYFFHPAPGTPKWSGVPDLDDYGELALFAHPFSRVWSSLPRAPSADYWSQYMLGRIWLSTTPGARYRPMASDRPDVIAHGISTSNSVRVLMLNVSTEPRAVTFGNTDLPQSGYLYEWGAREYSREGTDDVARAVVNAGPSSRPVAIGAQPIVLEPLSINVLVATPASSSATVDVTHLAIAARTHLDREVHVSGSVQSTKAAPIDKLEASWDGAPFVPVPSVDGALDGPAEAFHLVNPTRPACSALTLRATAGFWVSRRTFPPFVDASRLEYRSTLDSFDDPSLPGWSANDEWCDGDLELVFNRRVLQIRYLNVAPKCGPSAIRYIGGAPGSDGVRFRFRTTGDSVRYAVGARSADQAPDDYDDPVVQLRGTQGLWTTVSLAWSEFQQPGEATLDAPLTGDKVQYLKFEVMGDDCGPGSSCPASGSVYVDSLQLIGCPPSGPG